MTSDRRWTEEDRELVAGVLRDSYEEARAQDEVAAAVLDALTAAGWRPPLSAATEPGTSCCCPCHDPDELTGCRRCADHG